MVSLRTKIFLKRLRRFFITTVIGGVVVVLPITIFLALVRFIFTITTRLLTPISNLLDVPTDLKKWLLDLIAFGIVIALFFIIGLIVRTEFGKRFFSSIERNWLSQLPLYATVRDTVQQFTGQKKMPFSQVVLVDIFGTPTRMTGFVTAELGDNMYTVFVPTGPNPTNGFIFHVAKEQIEFVDTRPDEAMRTIIGVGTGSEILFQKKEEKKKREEAEKPVKKS